MPAHRCPPWCHECPEILDIVRSQGREPEPLDIMPWCMGGIIGGMDECHCERADPHIDAMTIALAQWHNAQRPELEAKDELRARRRALASRRT